jgi:hypothetical protein
MWTSWFDLCPEAAVFPASAFPRVRLLDDSRLIESCLLRTEEDPT